MPLMKMREFGRRRKCKLENLREEDHIVRRSEREKVFVERKWKLES